MDVSRVMPTLILFGCVLLFKDAAACFCLKTHPQTDLCQLSSFALIGSVDSVEEHAKNNTFHVSVIHLMKYPTVDQPRQLTVTTYKGPTVCEAKLSVSKTYVLTGYIDDDNVHTINSCMWTAEWDTIPEHQVMGLVWAYDCDCYIDQQWGLVPSTATPDDICRRPPYEHTCEPISCTRDVSSLQCEWRYDCNANKESNWDIPSPDVFTRTVSKKTG